MENTIPTELARQTEELVASGDYYGAIARLEAERRRAPCRALAQRILDLRIEASRHMSWREPGLDWPRATVSATTDKRGLAEIPARELDTGSLQAGVVGSGGLIVRGLVDAARVSKLRDGIDRTLLARHAAVTGDKEHENPAWYARSKAVAGGPVQFGMLGARKQADSGSVWAVDSPTMALELIDLYHELGLPGLLSTYFGEPALLSVKKWVLRKVRPNPTQEAGWHQDGRFLGDGIRTVNLWIALSDCGGEALAPGMDIVPASRRVIHRTGTDGAAFDWTVGPGLVEQITQDTPEENPRFQPGDALFFDEYNLHRTGFAPHHTDYRYAVESWFFAASRAPAKQFPVLL